MKFGMTIFSKKKYSDFLNILIFSFLILLISASGKNNMWKDEKYFLKIENDKKLLNSTRNFIIINRTNTHDDSLNYTKLKKKLCDFKKLNENIKKIHKQIKFPSPNKTDNNLMNNFTRQIEIVSKNNTFKNLTNSSSFNESDLLNNSITSDDLISIIANQTENIKNEICTSCLEINTSLDILIYEIKKIKKNLKKFETVNDLDEIGYLTLAHFINNVNLIKADLFKLNEILQTIQKADCLNYQESFKKYSSVSNYSMKLIELIQNIFNKLNIDINIVILN